MRISRYFYLPLLLLAAWGCEETIDIELEDQEPLLVINAQLSSDVTEHTVYLSLSSVSNVSAVKGATVEVSINGGAPITAVESEEDTDEWNKRYYRAYVFDAALTPGDKVRISARSKERSAWAEVTLAPRVNILQVDTSSVQIRSYDTYTESDFQFKADIQDPEGDNFYRFHAVVESDMVFNVKEGEPKTQHVVFNLNLDTSNDPVISEGLSTGADNDLAFFSVDNAYAVFSDELFRNTRRTFRFTTSPYALQQAIWYWEPDMDWDNITTIVSVNRRVGVMLYTMDYTSYRYLKSLNNMETFGYEQQILIEPTTLPSNVEGGTGFVGAYTASEVVWFDLPEAVVSTNDPQNTGDEEDNEDYQYQD